VATLKNTRINDTGNLTLPVGPSNSRPANPEARQMRFNSTLGRIEQFIPDAGWTSANN